MDEKMIEVPAGYRVPGHEYMVVTDMTACGADGILYHTSHWLVRKQEAELAWRNRSWWRRMLGLAPKGYALNGTEAGSVLGSVFEQLLGARLF